MQHAITHPRARISPTKAVIFVPQLPFTGNLGGKNMLRVNSTVQQSNGEEHTKHLLTNDFGNRRLLAGAC